MSLDEACRFKIQDSRFKIQDDLVMSLDEACNGVSNDVYTVKVRVRRQDLG